MIKSEEDKALPEEYSIKFSYKTLKRLFAENCYRSRVLHSASLDKEADSTKELSAIFKSAKKLSYSATFIYSILRHKPLKALPSNLRYDAYTSLKEEYYLYNYLSRKLLELSSTYALYSATLSLYLIPINEISNLSSYLLASKKLLAKLKRSKLFRDLISHYVIKLELCWKHLNKIPHLLLHYHFIFTVDHSKNSSDTANIIYNLLKKYFNPCISVLVDPIKSITKYTHYITKSFDNSIFHPKHGYIRPISIAIVLSELRNIHPIVISRSLNLSKKRRMILNDFINSSKIDISQVYLPKS